APLWSAAQACANRSPQAVRRAINASDEVADHQLGDLLFDTIVAARQGTAVTRHDYDDVWSFISHADRKVRLVVPQMLEWLARLDPKTALAP
ncbi:hypothetical protein ACSTHB_23495, partial [Vibrio parahaemolyticus]